MKNPVCPICHVEHGSFAALDRHLADMHPGHRSPYACTACSVRFASAKALRQHMRKKHREHPAPAGKAPSDATPSSSPAPKKPRVDAARPLVQWVEQVYNPSRGRPQDHLGAATIARIEQFAQSLRFEVLNDENADGAEETTCRIPLEDALRRGDVQELVDTWMDRQLQVFQLQTVNNHVRHLRVLAQFHAPEHPILAYLDDVVGSTQLNTSTEHTTLEMLKMEDPFGLVRIRDRVVQALRREQIEYLDPHIVRGSQPDGFGPRLRNWLELAIRFTNIPCRVQCSRELVLPSYAQNDYVCKLVDRGAQFYRLINRDKVHKFQQPLAIPLGRSLSAYMRFYLDRCRSVPNDPAQFHVFLSSTGGNWRNISRDLKRYLETTLGIPTHELDPTGRFIHGSRAIVMAAFSLAVAFDNNKMQDFARLLRHSSVTNEKHYSMWRERFLSMRAVDTFAVALGDPADLDGGAGEQNGQYKPVQLRIAPACLLNKNAGIAAVPYRGSRSVGTQTDRVSFSASDRTKSESVTENVSTKQHKGKIQEVELADTVPPCATCGQYSLELRGPFGSQRRRKYYGRYFLACRQCNMGKDGHFKLGACLWYPLGYQPLGEKSRSTQPRNNDAIQTFLGKRDLYETGTVP